MEFLKKIKIVISITLITIVVFSGNVFAMDKCKTAFNVKNATCANRIS